MRDWRTIVAKARLVEPPRIIGVKHRTPEACLIVAES